MNSSSDDKLVAALRHLLTDLSIAFDNAAKELNAPAVQSNKSHNDILQQVADHVPSESQVTEEMDGKKLPYNVESFVADNYHEMMKDELKTLCRQRNLGVSGSKWDLVTRLVAFDTERPCIPAEAVTSFDLQFFERQSNSDKDWNQKCHSGQSMNLYLHICEDKKQDKFIVVYCHCKKMCLRGTVHALVTTTSNADVDPPVVYFVADDTNQMWKKYLCTFKATFQSKEDADHFRLMFRNIQVDKKVDEYDLVNDEFQSQMWY